MHVCRSIRLHRLTQDPVCYKHWVSRITLKQNKTKKEKKQTIQKLNKIKYEIKFCRFYLTFKSLIRDILPKNNFF